MMNKEKVESLVFNKVYVIQKKISSGSFGTVYLVQDISTKENFAMKLEEESKDPSGICSVLREADILGKLQGIPGIPKMV